MANFFQRPLRLPKVPHSYEDMSHNFKTTTKFGLLTPVGIEEVCPSDETKSFSPAAFMRLSPLLYPIMHRVNARIHTFEVPFRIIMGDKAYQQWLNGEIDFISVQIVDIFHSEDQYNALPKYDIFTTLGYKRKPFDAEASAALQPQVLYDLDNGIDYLAMLSIWRNWFSDSQIDDLQNQYIDNVLSDYESFLLQQSTFQLTYGNLVNELYARLPQDYFTTARTEPQYGDPVNLTGTPTKFTIQGNNQDWFNPSFNKESGDMTTGHMQDSSNHPLTLDLTIRELWRREQIQRFFDVTNTFGSRIREWIAGHMGIIFPDDRLMIPRLLQTVSQSFTISEVMQTAPADSSPLGSYAGKGTLAMRGHSFKRLYVEHGLVISLLSVVPVTGYANGQQRYQFKKSVFDFAIPEFNNIGYQEIFKGELYNGASDPKSPFGYTLRYSEYRSHPNRCTNGFSDDPTLVDFHMNRKFDSMPGLNGDFISSDQDQFYRIFADEAADMDSILVDCAIIHKMWRPVSSQPSSMHL